jgi:multimeric flavodoxin WrbA
MKTLLIVYHSRTGGTRQMAEAAAMGAAAEPGVDVRLLQAIAAGPEDVLAADGYIFAAPENLAALAGLMKDFFDRSYYPVLGRVNGRPWPHDLRRQRRRECIPTGSAHRDRMAFAGRGGASHPLHTCANARGDPCAKGHRR